MQKSDIKIAPSILAGDFGHLADEARRIQDAGADYLHIDVMDGHFVPNLTIGPQAVAAINRATDLFLDVHIMIYNPFEYVERFVEAGADCLTFHFEATEDVEEILSYIRRCNILAGLAFRPETSSSFVTKYLDKCDLVLLMTVSPGFGGQSFMNEVIDKIRYTREMCERLPLGEQGVKNAGAAIQGEKARPLDIEVDGGINAETAALCAQAGANVFVAGTSLFQESDMRKAIFDLREAAWRAAVEK